MGRTLGSKNKSAVEVIEAPVKEPEIQVKEVKEVKVKVRKHSDNKDHKGEGEPLCLGCNHRADMHYIEQRWTERRLGRNLQGDTAEIEIPMRKPNYDGARPCQHACKCTSYE